MRLGDFTQYVELNGNTQCCCNGELVDPKEIEKQRERVLQIARKRVIELKQLLKTNKKEYIQIFPAKTACYDHAYEIAAAIVGDPRITFWIPEVVKGAKSYWFPARRRDLHHVALVACRCMEGDCPQKLETFILDEMIEYSGCVGVYGDLTLEEFWNIYPYHRAIYDENESERIIIERYIGIYFPKPSPPSPIHPPA